MCIVLLYDYQIIIWKEETIVGSKKNNKGKRGKSKKTNDDLWQKMIHHQEELIEIRNSLSDSFLKGDSSDYHHKDKKHSESSDDHHKDRKYSESSDYHHKDRKHHESSSDEFHKKDRCKCHMHNRVLSHGHNPCFDRKHDHHSCFGHHHGHGNHSCNGHHHGHGNCSCFGHHHGHENCSRCGHHHDKCSCSHKGHHNCNDFFFVDHCCGPKAFSHNNHCNDRFHLHLAGLTGNLNFHLFRKQGCCAKVEFECSSETQTVEGRVCDIGVDFLDILKDDKTTLTIMKQKICSIHWLDKCKCDDHFKPCEEDEESPVEPESPADLNHVKKMKMKMKKNLKQ